MNNEIKQLLADYQAGLNNKDLAKIDKVFAENATFIGQPFPTAIGKEAILATYEGFLSQLDFNIEFEIKEVVLDTKIGFVYTASKGTISPIGVEPEGAEGNREIFIVELIDGAWKFNKYIFNAELK